MKYIIAILALALTVTSASAQTKKSTKKTTTTTTASEPEATEEVKPTRAAKSSKFERQYGMAGCGLGSVVMGKQGGQVSAATTNGTLSNQTFGITAGTLNCLDSATAEVAQRMDQFIIVNQSQLQGDIAKGNGETISALSSFLGCSQASGEIGQSLKANYSTIFSTQYANEITDSIINVILSNPELSTKCQNIVG